MLPHSLQRENHGVLVYLLSTLAKNSGQHASAASKQEGHVTFEQM